MGYPYARKTSIHTGIMDVQNVQQIDILCETIDRHLVFVSQIGSCDDFLKHFNAKTEQTISNYFYFKCFMWETALRLDAVC